MTRHEYEKVEGAQPNAASDLPQIQDVLNELGAEGWELKSVRPKKANPQEIDAFLKRPID